MHIYARIVCQFVCIVSLNMELQLEQDQHLACSDRLVRPPFSMFPDINLGRRATKLAQKCKEEIAACTGFVQSEHERHRNRKGRVVSGSSAHPIIIDDDDDFSSNCSCVITGCYSSTSSSSSSSSLPPSSPSPSTSAQSIHEKQRGFVSLCCGLDGMGMGMKWVSR